MDFVKEEIDHLVSGFLKQSVYMFVKNALCKKPFVFVIVKID